MQAREFFEEMHVDCFVGSEYPNRIKEIDEDLYRKLNSDHPEAFAFKRGEKDYFFYNINGHKGYSSFTRDEEFIQVEVNASDIDILYFTSTDTITKIQNEIETLMDKEAPTEKLVDLFIFDDTVDDDGNPIVHES